MEIDMTYKRRAFDILLARLNERRRFIQVLAGPRQSGKTTLARQIAASMGSPVVLISADDPSARSQDSLRSRPEERAHC
jgi:predicted AAA+ superfamily ATPase